MKTKDFLNFFIDEPYLETLALALKPNEGKNVKIKGLKGSLDAVVASTIYALNNQTHIFVTHDKEEAAYFQNDLQNLLPHKDVLLFPTSYKKPYTFEDIENANILQRAEILNKINHKASTGELIVTYPDALTEKVINKKSLLKNTFTAKTGDSLDTAFLSELLIEYDFEKTDFVYEAGQFAIRGGILDVFSFANDLPYRIELFGDEIESIRTFDPHSQLSKDALKTINIIPNIQTRLIEETRQSFLDFVPKNTKLWFKDYELTLNILTQYFIKATESFESILKESGNTQIVLNPEDLFERPYDFDKKSMDFVRIEFGNKFCLKKSELFEITSSPQPSFARNFDTIADKLSEYQNEGKKIILAAESPKQLERLHGIFEEIEPDLTFDSLTIGLRNGFIDEATQIVCFTDHELFERFFKYKSQSKFSKSKALTVKELNQLQPGDYVTHIDYGIGKFAGLEKKEKNGKIQEAIRLIYRDNDLLYVNIHTLHKISRYSGKEGLPPAISKLGSQEWDNKKSRVKKKVADIARELIELYAKRKGAPGFPFSKDGFMQAELESSFMFEDTPDQSKATNDLKEDMEKAHPMDRLICGDVGFGKTEVAIRAAFKAAADGKQVAVLVPTTILAMQHYRTFSERLSEFPVSIDYVSRFKTTGEIKEILKKVKEGNINILIGTHRIVSKDVKFKDLGLLIIDEEQKFGVKTKDRLKEMKVNVDVLTLTATPIPRTLHFSLMGARDLSIISTPPPNRQPVTTEIHSFNETLIRDAISFELRRGGQVFFIHNRVKDIDQIANIVLRLVPDARIGVAHGQMDGPKLEKRMLKFIDGEYDVLVSTNIVESGLDIPNANTIIINHAHMFGLSDVHQMRGRVGRSNKKAFCYLLTPPTIGLSSDARKRLKTLEEFSDLGDGYKVALRDLDIRGAGNMLGAEQTGFISDIGFDMYHKILDEAVQELKETEFSDLFAADLKKIADALVQDCSIETDLELLIPETYVSNVSERLRLYTDLDNINDEEKLAEFTTEIRDRFGPIPDSVKELIDSVRLRWKAQNLGFEKLRMKSGNFRGYFVEDDKYFNSEKFGSILKYVTSHPRTAKLRELKGKPILDVEDIDSIEKASVLMENIVGVMVGQG